MNRCEDFPCCGHYDRDGSFCPNPDTGAYPAPVYLPSYEEDPYDAYDAYEEDFYVYPAEDDCWDDEPFVQEDALMESSLFGDC